jgi:hypothetical protein
MEAVPAHSSLTATIRQRSRLEVESTAVILGVTALGIAGWGIDRTLTHGLLSEDFSVDDGAFASGERSAYEVDVYEGTYRMTVKSLSTFPIRSFEWFADSDMLTLTERHTGTSTAAGVRSLMPNAETTITGSIDGVEVIEATDGSFDSFDAAGLVFFSREAGDSVQFDDVTASVPE